MTTPPKAASGMQKHGRLRQSGAALLLAMLIVTLVASFAASALWQQWRAVEIESAERARVQSGWILVGARDWARLILREDALARGDGTDNLNEPWAVPLAEARLSTFLAAGPGGVAQAQDGSANIANAFLAGRITDMQARLNLRNLAETDGHPTYVAALRQFARLFDYLGLPQSQLEHLTQQLRLALAQEADNPAAALPPQSVEQLGWLGLPPESVAALTPHVTLLPIATKVNLNTAGAIVLWASADGLDMAQAQQLVQARERHHFGSVSDAVKVLGLGTDVGGSDALPIRSITHTVASSYFEVDGRLRLGNVVVQERALVLKLRGGAQTLWRSTQALAL